MHGYQIAIFMPHNLQVLPEPVDTMLFSPASAALAVLPQGNGEEFGSFGRGEQHPIVALFPFLRGVVGPKTTVFLSVFKWEKRKGWDVLLDAYFREFGPSDDVL